MTNTLVTLAMLKANHRVAHRDHLDVFVPLVANLIRVQRLTRIHLEDVGQLSAAFEQMYGIRIPHHPMVAILGRTQREGYVTRVNSEFLPVVGRLADLEAISSKWVDAEAAWHRLISAFLAYAKELGLTLDEAEANAAFLGFLRERDVDITAASHRATVLPDALSTDENIYAAHSFTRFVSQSDRDLFEFIASMATGHLLATTLLCTPGLDTQRRFRGMFMYLDAPLILDLLGIGLVERCEATRELVKALHESGAQLRCLESTYDEAIGLLQGAKSWIANPLFDPWRATRAASFIHDSGMSATTLDAMIASVTDVLRSHSITRFAGPEPSALVEYQVDEDLLTETICSVYGDSNPHFNYLEKKWTVQQDVRALTAINKLRRGLRPQRLHDAKHIFVSHSRDLAYASRVFDRAAGLGRDSVPACVTDMYIGTVVWLSSDRPDEALNEKRLMADCVTALQPDKRFVAEFFKELDVLKADGLVDDLEYEVLRVDTVARELLGQATLNTNFTPRTAEEVIEAYRLRQQGVAAQKLAVKDAETRRALGQLVTYRENASRAASVFANALVGILLLAGVLILIADAVFWRGTFAAFIGIASLIAGGSLWGYLSQARPAFEDWAATALVGSTSGDLAEVGETETPSR